MEVFMKQLDFLSTEVILDRLELEARKAGLSLNELWDRIDLEERTMKLWRTGKHLPTLASLQHIQSVINSFIRENSDKAGSNNVA